MRWLFNTILQAYHFWEPIEKMVVHIKKWVQRYIPPLMMEMIHIDNKGYIQTFYKQTCFFPKKWSFNNSPHLFIFHLWNNKTQQREYYCLSKQQVKEAFGFKNDITLHYLNHFERDYLVSTITSHVSQLEKVQVLSVIPYKKYCRGLEPYKTTVMGVQNLTALQLCQLASFVSRICPPKLNESCQAMIIDEKLKETVKYDEELLFPIVSN